MIEEIKRYSEIVESGAPIQNRLILAIPMTGTLRSEWVLARYGQIIPVNWSVAEIIQWFDTFSSLHFAVDAARNIAVGAAVAGGFDWLLFVDHDVILPRDTFVTMNEYIQSGKYPVVSGLYAAKGMPAEPLLFRGKGTSWFRDWKRGDKVWVDGIPMGCTLISVKLLKAMWDASEEYQIHNNIITRKVFWTPRVSDWKENGFGQESGTEDLWWCNRVIQEKWLEKAGFEDLAKEKYPFLVDTNMWCGHINPDGKVYFPDTGR